MALARLYSNGHFACVCVCVLIFTHSYSVAAFLLFFETGIISQVFMTLEQQSSIWDIRYCVSCLVLLDAGNIL